MAGTIQLGFDSRLKDTELLNASDTFGSKYKDKVFFGLWERPDEFQNLNNDDMSVHMVREHEVGRLDLISFEYYGVSSLWSVIAMANDIVEAICEMFPGQRLLIPSVELVTAFRRRRESGEVQPN